MSSEAYNEGAPIGSNDSGDLEVFIQTTKRNFRQRLQQGGKRFTGFDADVPTTSEQHDGKSAVGWENQTDRGDNGYITLAWSHDGQTPLIRLYGSTHATKANTLEIPGNLSFTGTTFASGVAAGAHARAIFSDPLPAIGYLKRIIYKASDASGAPNRSLKKIKIIVGTRPTSANLVLVLRKRTVAQQTVSNDPFIDGNTTAIAAATATLAVGANYSVEVTLGAPETIQPGEELIATWTTVGAAADVTVLLQIE
jgi:hypothetical protein